MRGFLGLELNSEVLSVNSSVFTGLIADYWKGSSLMYNPPTLYSNTDQHSPFLIVRLLGLPFICVETDIADFFHGLDMVDVLFVHKIGKFTREASSVLGYPFQVNFAFRGTGSVGGAVKLNHGHCDKLGQWAMYVVKLKG
ncbi:hypothetical protein F0562_010616 [Nyssa sinensis]|uniref:Uncharacterized protein n=1 Tax=Nyssa sinensis TaxID=561372 RepID=A0A5J4ZZG4_9ASTE|nr:hypothetical protein F0562_010616 [Nyssa sinensis]